MHSVIVNGKKIIAQDGSPLKEILGDLGFSFPCGGTGRCGKCRITCPELSPTPLDGKFLSPRQISDGIRLACDKTVTSSLTISCELAEKSAPVALLKECSLAVSVTDEEIDVGIIGEDLAETVTVRNPLDLSSLSENYEKDPSSCTNALRAAIGKTGVELFEKYGAAKASVVALAAKEIYLKILAGQKLNEKFDYEAAESGKDAFGLPGESLYILPGKGDFIGGEIFAESIRLKERSLLIDCEKTVTFLHLDEKDNLAASFWNCDYSDEVAPRCFRAAVKFFTEDKPAPIICLCGRYARKAEDFLAELPFNIAFIRKSLSSVASAALSFRVRSKLNRESAATTVVRLYDNETFQKFLTEEV